LASNLQNKHSGRQVVLQPLEVQNLQVSTPLRQLLEEHPGAVVASLLSASDLSAVGDLVRTLRVDDEKARKLKELLWTRQSDGHFAKSGTRKNSFTRKGGMCGRGFQWTLVEDDNTEQSSGSGLSPAANPGNNVPHAQSPVFRLLWPEIGTLRTETQLRQRLVSAGFVEEGARLFNYNALLSRGLTSEEAHLLARRISLNVDLDMNDIMGRCMPSPLPIALTRVVLSGSTGPCTTAGFTHRFQGSTLQVTQEKRNSSLCRSYVAMLSIVRCQIVVTCVTSPCIQQKCSSTTTERLCTCGDISLYAAGLRRQLRCTQGVHFRHHRQ